MRSGIRRLAATLCLATLAGAQPRITLQPQTVAQFDAYIKGVEASLDRRWCGKAKFLVLDEHPDARAAVMRGEVWIDPSTANNPAHIRDALIHDWTGAVFIPNAAPAKVVSIMQDFDHHRDSFGDIQRSRLLSKHDGDVTGYWRLGHKQPMFSLVLDIIQEAHWREIAPGKWICRSYGKDISEVEHAGAADEEVLPPGQGSGYLWRLYGYWSIEAVNGGVIAECRSLSLTRDFPPMLSWIVKPFLQTLPRQSLEDTLVHLRDAAQK